jgi:5'-3' exonuclease
MSNLKKVFIVDITDCFYQQWNIEDRPLIINDDFISRFSNKILSMSDYYQSSHAVAVADTTESWRKDSIKDYSFNGQKIPIDIYKGLERVDKKLQEGGWGPILRKSRMEAIDIIWRIIKSTKNKTDITKKVISSDLRLLSLVGVDIEIESYFVKHEVERVKDEGWIDFKMGIEPSQVSDFLALSGCKSNNIHGIAGIGPKKAKLLLNRFGKLENIIKNIDSIDGQLGLLLEEYKKVLKNKDALLGKKNIDLKMSFLDIKIKHKKTFKSDIYRYI